MSDEDVALNYRDCARFALSAKKVEDSLQILQNL